MKLLTAGLSSSGSRGLLTSGFGVFVPTIPRAPLTFFLEVQAAIAEHFMELMVAEPALEVEGVHPTLQISCDQPTIHLALTTTSREHPRTFFLEVQTAIAEHSLEVEELQPAVQVFCSQPTINLNLTTTVT